MITKKQGKIKLIYDQGLFLSETRGWDGFWFNTHPNLVTGKDGKVFKNGTSVILLSALRSSSIEDDVWPVFRLERDSENPSLDALSFALESISGDKNKCDIAPAFKNLTYKCEGKKSRLIDHRTPQLGVLIFKKLNKYFYSLIKRSHSSPGAYR